MFKKEEQQEINLHQEHQNNLPTDQRKEQNGSELGAAVRGRMVQEIVNMRSGQYNEDIITIEGRDDNESTANEKEDKTRGEDILPSHHVTKNIYYCPKNEEKG